MALLVTDAIVLHAFDYRETSRILRLATREGGVRSVVARGAKRPKSRFGIALDLFAEGAAQIALHPTGDLHTLTAFDVTRARTGLAERWSRFGAASALSEVMLRFAHEEAQPALFDSFAASLDALMAAEGDAIALVGLGAGWRLVAELGFAPVLEECASCGAPIEPDAVVRFAHRAGGTVCAKCAVAAAGAREIPARARSAIVDWLAGEHPSVTDERDVRAHLRLLREFLHEHLADHRPLRAFAVWERGDWSVE